MNDLLKLPNKLKRDFMKLIDTEYVKKKLEKRRGRCRKCGQCCKGCKFLENKLCIIYENRPFFCYKEFPLDKADQKIWQVKNCGFKFKN